jgi:hypothetical protein
MNYRCLVCGYDQMPHPPRDYSICPCCGVEYAIDDAFDSHLDIRNEWLRRGAPWFSRLKPYAPPANWNAWEQLDSVGYRYDVGAPSTPIRTDVYEFDRVPGLLGADWVRVKVA